MRSTFYGLSFAFKPYMPGIMYYSILVIHLNRHSGACALCTYMTYVFVYVCASIPKTKPSNEQTKEQKKTNMFLFRNSFEIHFINRSFTLQLRCLFRFGFWFGSGIPNKFLFFSIFTTHDRNQIITINCLTIILNT